MAGTMSGQITVQALGSGTDWTDMISKLKSYEEIPKQRMEVWRAEWNMRITAFQDIMSAMSTAKTALSALSSMSKMVVKIADSSKPEVATAKATGDVPEGVYSVDVKQMARAATFSNKTVFSGKDEKINTSGDEQSFSYTYKGTTRTISVPNNCTLEQLVNKINNDGKNPGVMASMIKSGAGYVFQMQGKDTGAAASLSVESTLAAFDSTPHFSGGEVVLNQTGTNQEFTYFHKGKSATLQIADGMTAYEFITAFNKDPNNLGVTASLVQSGSDYVIQYKDSATQSKLNLTATSTLEHLGTLKSMNATDSINETGEAKSFFYNYHGKDYSFSVPSGTTGQGFVDLFKAKATERGQNIQARLDGGSSGNLQFFSQDSTLVSNDSNPMVFKYTDKDGKEKTLEVPAGTTLSEFADTLNASVKASGWTATYREEPPTSGQYSLLILDKDGVDITNTDAASNANFNLGGHTLSEHTPTTGYTSSLDALGGRKALSGKDVLVNNTGSSKNYAFSYGDPSATYDFDVDPGTTMSKFVEEFNRKFSTKAINGGNSANIGVTASIVSTGSGYEIKYTDDNDPTNKNFRLENVTTDMNKVRGAADNYYTQQAQDAVFTLNGLPIELTSDTNTLKEVVDGMTITLKSEGTTTFAVSNDKDALKENIVAAVDAINTLLATIKELTKYDPDKEVKAPETDEVTGLLKMSSQFTWQKGQVLQGNYGVQLLQSRLKSMLVSSAVGFKSKQSNEDSLNDSFTVLSKIGLKTVSDESAENFGLLTIDEKVLDKALEDDFEGVAAVLAQEAKGSTTSSEFWVASTGTRAKAGTYAVSYDVDPLTKQATNVYINGVKAESDPDYPSRWTVGDYYNDAAGLAIQFGEGDMVDTGVTQHSTVQVKEGKIPQLVRQLGDELQPVAEGNKDHAGALPLLIDNYKGVIKNIDSKIEREVSRILSWEKRQKAKYARLETLLGEYYNQMSANESSLAQLKSKSSS